MVVGFALRVIGRQPELDAIQHGAIDLISDIGMRVEAVVVAAGIVTLHLPQ